MLGRPAEPAPMERYDDDDCRRMLDDTTRSNSNETDIGPERYVGRHFVCFRRRKDFQE